MGGVLNQDTVNSAAYTGGKPLHDWTGLENPINTPFTPNATRHTKYTEKGYNLRIAPPTTLFSKNASGTFDLRAFAKKVGHHLKNHGMDTTMYIESLTDANDMINVVEHYDQATLAQAISEQRRKEVLYDNYDRENDRAAVEFIEASIDADLKDSLSIRKNDDDGAAVVWMRILALIHNASFEKYNTLKDKLKALSPANEPGENITDYATKARHICRELDLAHQFEWVLVLYIIKALCQVQVESFRALFQPKRHSIDATLKTLTHVSKETAKATMVALGFHYSDILTLAEETYTTYLDNGEWHPSKMVKDSQQAPGLFNTPTKLDFFAMMKEAVQQVATEGAKANPTPPTIIADKGWRFDAPKAGKPTQLTRGERVFNWCSKCRGGTGMWTASHQTSSHGTQGTDKKRKDTPTTPPPAPDTDSGYGAHFADSGYGAHFAESQF
jgi:hypothetical protein